MKKILYVLSAVVVMAITSSCGCRSTKTTDCCEVADTTSVACDSTVVAVDTVVTE